jgi:RNA polymerase sigma factor (sigma-70 family)
VREPDSILTRASLVARLKDLGDQESWREFFDRYWHLIHAAACKAGLTPSEAEEVVQEVVIAASRKMPEFTYDPAKDSFKGWLLAVTRWKVADQFRNRKHAPDSFERDSPSTATGVLERVPGPDRMNSLWEAEWKEHLLREALEVVKKSVNPAHYEIYHLHVIQGFSVRDTAQTLGVSAPAVHLAKFRVQQVLKRAVKRLDQ